mgnify:CR=1 FL=1
MPVNAAKTKCGAVKSVNNINLASHRAADRMSHKIQDLRQHVTDVCGLYLFPHERLISIAANP